jgi:hypothetical protein
MLVPSHALQEAELFSSHQALALMIAGGILLGLALLTRRSVGSYLPPSSRTRVRRSLTIAMVGSVTIIVLGVVTIAVN